MCIVIVDIDIDLKLKIKRMKHLESSFFMLKIVLKMNHGSDSII